MARKLPDNLSEEILASYTPDYATNTLKVKAKILNGKNIDLKETELGDVHEVDFMPQVKMKKWYNDANMSIRVQEILDPSEPEVLTDENKVIYRKDTFEARFYLLDSCCLEQIPKATEFDIVLYNKPSTSNLDFTITSKNLVFRKQLPLTPEEIYEGVTRMPEVDNSYAVFHKSKRGGMYGTGKAFHIYRPIIYDAEGTYTYGDIEIRAEESGQNGTMRIVIPQSFLDNAVYPIIIDPTLGYTTIGASDTGIKDSIELNPYTSTDNGALQSMSLGVNTGAGTGRSIKMGIWKTSDNSRVGYTNTVTNSTNGWNTASFVAPANITPQQYFIGWKSNVTQMKVAFDAAPALPTYSDPDSFANTMPDPLVPALTTARQWSLYATYSLTYTFTGDCAIVKNIAGTYTGDAILMKRVIRTYYGDCNLKRIVKRTFTGDASILNTTSTIYLGRSNLKKTIRETFVGDTSLASRKYASYYGDANLRKIIPQGYFGDASFKKTLSQSYTGNAALVKKVYGTFTGDSSIAETKYWTFTGNSSLEKTKYGSYTSDAFLRTQTYEIFYGNSSLKKTLHRTYTGNAELISSTTFHFDGNASLLRTRTFSFTSDTSLEAVTYETFTGDARLAKENVGYFNGDSVLVKTVERIVYSTDWMAATMTGSYDEWTDPANALVDDEAYAQGSQIGAGSKRQSYHGFGFNIPSDAEILGVEVRYKHAETTVSGDDGKLVLHVVSPISQDGSKDSDYYLTKTESILGSTSDVWGLSLTYAEINDSTFGVDFEAVSYDTKNFAAYLYYVEMRVTVLANAAFAGDSNLIKTEQKEFSSDSNLAVTESGEFLGDASIVVITSESFTSGASIMKIVSETYSSDTNLEKTVIRTFISEARLLGEGEAQFRGNAYLYDSELKFLYGPWTYGTLYGGVIDGLMYNAENFTGDANLRISLDNQFRSYANLARADISSQYYGDANLERTTQASFTGDAHFAVTMYGSFSGDSNLKSVEPGVFSGDSYITHPFFKGDSNLSSNVSDYFYGESALVTLHVEAFYGDASLLRNLSSVFAGDANLYGAITTQFTGDASLLSYESRSFTGDSVIKTVVIDSFTGDANLVGTEVSTFTGDSNFVKYETLPFIGEANLIKELLRQFTGDASLQSIELTTFRGDANFDKQSVTGFSGEVILESRDQFAGFAGTVDCVSGAGLGWGISGMEEFGLNLGI